MTKLRLILIAAISMTLTGCLSNDYQFGDITKSVSKTMIEQYCLAGNKALREEIKKDMKANGVGLPVDACDTIAVAKTIVN